MKRRDALGHLKLLLALGVVVALVLPAAAAAEPPALTVDPAGAPSLVTVPVSGSVDANGVGSEWFFEVSAEGGDWIRTNLSGFSEAPDPETVEGTIEGLKAGTSYELRLTAYNFEEFVNVSSEPPVSFETDPAVAPALALGPAEGVTSDSAHISGTIDPEGGSEDAVAGVLPIAWELQVDKDEEGWNTVGSGELTGADAESDEAIDVEADATGLVPNSNYRFRLVARYAGLEAETPEIEWGEFDTEAIAPDVRRETLFNPTATSIQLRAQVNPHNSPLTDCHFEYGANGVFDRTAPCGSLPGGNGFTAVGAVVSNLTPATQYDFRLVATSAAGTTEGEVRSFTSLAEPTVESCPNEAIREAQHATHLTGCAAYEKVSPAEKGGGDIVGDGLTNIASVDGDAITFSTRTPFGDTIGSGVSGQTQYIGRRGSSGWDAHAITPTGQPEAPQTLFTPTRVQLFSEDLRTAVVWAYDLPAVADDTPLNNNIYVEDTATRSLETVTGSPQSQYSFLEFAFERFWGISDDARHLGVVAKHQFLPEAAPGVPNVYQWDGGVLSLAGILPNGEVPESGSRAGFEPEVGGYRRTMSADGSRLLFTASTGGNRQLYQRIDGERTVWISETELEPSDPSYQPDPSGVQLAAATPDGRNVFFLTDTPLVEDDKNAGIDLYRFTDSPDPENDANLTLITEDGEFGGGEVVGASDDGERIYLLYKSLNRLSVWNRGVTRVINTDVTSKSQIEFRLGVTASQPGRGRVTSDGRYLAYVVEPSSLTDSLGNLTNSLAEVYLYSLENDSLLCVSCPVGEATSEVKEKPAVTDGSPQITNVGIRPRFLSDNGEVFFSTAEALVPEDTNGILDAYRYDPVTGKRSLLSTGKGSGLSAFADASPSGNDVFLVSRNPLTGSDGDDLVDVYDVRAGGGLPEPSPIQPPACQGEACKGPAGAVTPLAPSVSQAESRGNVVSPRHRCPKHRAGKKRGAKAKHCHKPKRSKKTRTTDNDRRTTR